jgi:hypothetical protein
MTLILGNFQNLLLKTSLVAQYLPQLIDAILVNVEMSTATSMPNISKTVGGSGRKSLQQI